MNIKLRCKACKWRDKAENLGEQKLDDIFAEDKETNKDGRIYNKVGADELTRTVGDNETGSAVLHEERANNGERIANGERGQQTLDEVSIASSDKADALPEDTRGRVESDKAPEAVEPMSEGGFDIVATMPIVGNEDLINEYRKTINGTPTTYSFVPIARTASLANIIDSVWSRGGRVDRHFFDNQGVFNSRRTRQLDSMAIRNEATEEEYSKQPDKLLHDNSGQNTGANGQGLERAGADVSNSLRQGNDPFEEHRKILAEAKDKPLQERMQAMKNYISAARGLGRRSKNEDDKEAYANAVKQAGSDIKDFIDGTMSAGSKTVGKKPNTYEYTLTKGKDKFVVVTEKHGSKERFCDYYTNRKPSTKRVFTLTNTGGTQTLPTASSTKVENNSQTSNNSPEFMQLWHGSAAAFDHFDSSHFLSGEGSMFYGAGHYATE